MRHNINAEQLLDKLASELLTKLKQIPSEAILVGIHTGGAWLSEHLHKSLELTTPLGSLDIAFYRDDFTQKGLNPAVKGSNLPPNIEGQHIILVDDVIMSGRTIRAALNELFDYGRPASVTLVVMVDLDARELPIQADICGTRLKLTDSQRIKLSGPTPLQLQIVDVGSTSRSAQASSLAD